MINKKNTLLWFALTVLAIIAFLLIWQFGFREKMGQSASHGLADAPAQNKATSSVTTNMNPCIQQPIQIGEGDFTPVDNALKCIITEYTNAADRKDSERILALDDELKKLAGAINSKENHGTWDTFWRGLDKEVPKYEYQKTIGIFIDDHGIYYDGRLGRDKIVLSLIKVLPELGQIKPQFDQIRAAFMAIPKTPKIAYIEALYKLDEQLDKLVAEANGNFDRTSQFPDYPEIEVYKQGVIYYTGAIRKIADKLLPPRGFVDPKTGNKIEVKGERFSKSKDKLEEIYKAYNSLKKVPEDAEKLYELSEELGKLVKEIHKDYPGNRSQIFWDAKYEPIGLYVGHYSDQLDYGGKLVVDSYKLNPNSRYREATLVRAISGAGGMSELSWIPDIGLAELYLKEYPNGKYLKNVYSILATFFQNLYEELLAGDKSEAIFGCYSEYIAAHPGDKDREVVRNKAIGYYNRLLALDQQNQEGYKKALSNLENRIDGNTRYWCTD